VKVAVSIFAAPRRSTGIVSREGLIGLDLTPASGRGSAVAERMIANHPLNAPRSCEASG